MSRVGGQNLNLAISSKDLRSILSEKFNPRPIWKGKSFRKEIKRAYDDYVSWIFSVHRRELREALEEGGSGYYKNGKIIPWADVHVARLDMNAGNFQAAVASLSKPNSDFPEEFRYIRHFALGEAYKGIANAKISELTSANGNDDFGEYRRTSRSYKLALQSYEKAVINKPDFVPAYGRLAVLYEYTSRYEPGLKAANRLVELVPLCSEAYCIRGCYRHHLGLLQLAREDFNRSISLDSHSELALANLGALLSRLRLYEEAIKAYHSAVNAGFSPVLGYFGIAKAYEELEQYDKAITFLNLVIDEGGLIKEATAKINELQKKRQK